MAYLDGTDTVPNSLTWEEVMVSCALVTHSMTQLIQARWRLLMLQCNHMYG